MNWKETNDRIISPCFGCIVRQLGEQKKKDKCCKNYKKGKRCKRCPKG